MKRYTIRLMQPDEVETVVLLWRRSREEAQPWLEARMGHSPDDDLGFFRDSVCKECTVWVALHDGAVVGLLACTDQSIEQLYVDPPAYGSGAGTALLDFAKAQMPEGFRLFTHQRNHRARGFYEGRGLRAVAFGVSAAPESEPDVEYRWDPPSP